MQDSEEQLNEVLEELSLLLIYLTRFREKKQERWQAWKGYDFSVLDHLQREECISFSYRAKSLYLEDKGIARAKELMKKYTIQFGEEQMPPPLPEQLIDVRENLNEDQYNGPSFLDRLIRNWTG